MGKLVKALGSNGWKTVTVATDIIARTATEEGWSQTIPTRYFEFYAKDDVEVSVNGATSFTLLAGDEWTETEDYIESFEVITTNANYRYLAKF